MRLVWRLLEGLGRVIVGTLAAVLALALFVALVFYPWLVLAPALIGWGVWSAVKARRSRRLYSRR